MRTTAKFAASSHAATLRDRRQLPRARGRTPDCVCADAPAATIHRLFSDVDMMKICMRLAAALATGIFSASIFAKLPPPTEDAKVKAAEVAAKSAWNDKVGLYNLCIATDRIVAAYRNSAKAAGRPVGPPVSTAPCADPGAYESALTPEKSKPLEASGAHSPPGTVVSPPSSTATAAEISTAPKKY